MFELVMLAVLIGFATWRIFHLWRIDDICEPLRNYVFSWFPPADVPLATKPRDKMTFPYNERFDMVPLDVDNVRHWLVAYPASFIGRLLNCGWCFTFWISGAITFVSWLSWVSFAPFVGWVLVWFTAWAVACLLYSRFS